MLRHAAGAHGPPFVVIAAQPHFRDGIVPLILIDLHGVDMAVVINDRHFCRVLMIKLFCRLGFQQKLLFWFLYLSKPMIDVSQIFTASRRP